MKIHAFLGKGGIGKTTLAVQLAEELNKIEECVIVGVDQQHNHKTIIEDRGYKVKYECINPEMTDIIYYIIDETPINKFKQFAPFFANDFIEMVHLSELLWRVKDSYNHVILDLPPNHSSLGMIALPNILETITWKALTLKHRVNKMVKGQSDFLDKTEYLNKIFWYCGDVMKKANDMIHSARKELYRV